MHDKPRRPFIFIVYHDSEVDLADSLTALFEGWGYDASYIRHERDVADYRSELRERIFKCDLVVLLLSREFRWSSHCQAEVGSAMILEKPFVPIVVSPATLKEVEEIAPALAGSQYEFTNDPNLVTRLEEILRAKLVHRNERLTKLLSRLHALEGGELQSPRTVYDPEEVYRRRKVEDGIRNIEEKYRLFQPKKAISSAWPSLADRDCWESIVGNIRKSLEDRSNDTVLVVVGVSLKYSLNLIATALEKAGRLTAEEAGTSKKLRITLVHMDSESHILHAMGDARDISSIRDNFDDINWPKIHDTWKSLSALLSIELEEPIRHRIDYIPPRVGILIDDKFLYAGSCSFRLIGDFDVPMRDVHTNATLRAGNIPIFNLDVGENEYRFYKRSQGPRKNNPDASHRAMREFKGSVVAYRQAKFNVGVIPLWESDEWIKQIRMYISACKQSDEIIFVSATPQRFEPLIRNALGVGAKVKIYLHDADPGLKAVSDYTNWLQNSVGDKIARATILGYEHSPTFRAVIVGDVAIGLQPYTSAGGKLGGPEITRKLPLCFIINSRFSRFAELKRSVLESLEE
jgi:TIR domain